MAHKFDARNMEKLDDARRAEILPPRDALLETGLKPGQTFLDVGAGTGNFAFSACEIVGEKGRVIAVDISDKMVAELKRRASLRGFRNIEIRESGEYDSPVEDGTIDMALLSLVLHEIDDKARFLGILEKTLARGGRLCVIEWEKKAMNMGPPVEERLDPGEITELLAKVGLTTVMERKYGDLFYCVTAVKGKDGGLA